MGRADREAALRIQGMQYARDYALEHGLDAMVADVNRRARYQIPLSVGQDELNEFTEKAKNNIFNNVVLLMMVTIRDELDFGEKRITRLMQRFWKKAECLADDYTTWDDMSEILASEVGIDAKHVNGDLNVRINRRNGKHRRLDQIT